MKTVAIIIPRFGNKFSGGENYVASLARHLTKKFKVHIITKMSDEVYPNMGDVQIHHVDGLSSSNVNILKALPNLKSTLDSIKPDIVHVHCFISLFLYSSIIEWGKYRTVVTVHSTPDGKGKLFSWFDSIPAQKSFLNIIYDKVKCDVTIFGSNYYMEEYTKGVPLMKEISDCYVNPYYSDFKGISLSERKKLDKHIKQDNIVRILFPSRIVKRKGIEETLELLKMLPENYVLDLPAMPQMEYQEYNNVILTKIKEMNLEDRVFYPNDVVIGEEMIEYYKKADITIIPSYFEGFGIVAVEALDTCSPVISTCTGGLNEIIEDGVNGVKMSLDDLEDAKEKIIRMINDIDYRYFLIGNGKKTIKDKYSKERHMELIDKIYDGLVVKK